MFRFWFVNSNLSIYNVTAHLTALTIMILIFLPLHEIVHIKVASRFLGHPVRIRDFSFFDFFDSFGAVSMLIFQYGWAKRFMYFDNLPSNKHEVVITYLSGPLFNFLSAVIFNVLAILISFLGLSSNLVLEWISLVFYCISGINVIVTSIDLFPIPPFDGFKAIEVFIPTKYLEIYYRNHFVVSTVLMTLLLFGVFNIPIQILKQIVYSGVSILSLIPFKVIRTLTMA